MRPKKNKRLVKNLGIITGLVVTMVSTPAFKAKILLFKIFNIIINIKIN